ncbi:hypothetical protein EU509_20550 [Pseudoalteromonas fuliginea]|uniref:Transposon Tn7 transposition protein TnsD C-termianl domain-containing protein n=2 Tax=Pseudoalteromonas fuliginea TaxID=1872678 RepID=A0ABQ6RD95_9GAMM|nr:hypothetical protein EU509_20550 [Pseudoalteromonas fuliginea]KAA1165235.1 hypothetical protein EUZ79_20535 [Pseudoalteromonas fuliginea]
MASIVCIDVAALFGGRMAFIRNCSLSALLPNETIYSWLARAGLISGLATDHDFLLVRLGYTGQQLTSIFPPFIVQVSQSVGLDINEIITKHGVLPFFKPFIRSDTFKNAHDNLSKGLCVDSYNQFSLLANRIPEPTVLSYCSKCAAQDIKNVGVAYWHVAHQLPWINYCPFHLIKLEAIKRERKLLALPPQVASEDKGLTQASLKQARLAQDAYALWSLNLEAIDSDVLRKIYLHGLNANNLVCNYGSVRQGKWQTSLKEYWVNELPKGLFDAVFGGSKSNSYPSNFIYQSHAQFHSLKHLLVIQHLFGSLSEFLKCCSNPNQLNVRPDHVINDVFERVNPEKTDLLLKQLRNGMSMRQAAKRANVSVGYAKSIAMQNNIRIHRRAQFLFATERKQILSRLKAGELTTSIAKEMECSQSAVEQLLTQFPDIKELRIQLRFEKQRDIHRSAVKECLNSLEIPTCGKVQKFQRSAYTWLFKHDKEWLYKALPEAIPRINRRRVY